MIVWECASQGPCQTACTGLWLPSCLCLRPQRACWQLATTRPRANSALGSSTAGPDASSSPPRDPSSLRAPFCLAPLRHSGDLRWCLGALGALGVQVFDAMLRPQRMLIRHLHPAHSSDRRESRPGPQHLPMTPSRPEPVSGPLCTQTARRQMGLGGPGQGAALPSMPCTPRTGHLPGPEPLPWPALASCSGHPYATSRPKWRPLAASPGPPVYIHPKSCVQYVLLKGVEGA